MAKEDNTNGINIGQLQSMLYRFIKFKKPFMVKGAPGIGKSDSVRQAAQKYARELYKAKNKLSDEKVSKLPVNTFYSEGTLDEEKFSFIDIRISQLDPSDLRGIPFPEGNKTKWLIPSWLPTGGYGVLFFDEINLAPPSIQASCFMGNTIISGKEYKQIKDLKIGDTVIDKDGNLHEVYELKSRDYTGDMFNVKGRNFMPISATTEHPFLVIDEYRKENKKHKVKQKVSKPKWVKAENLEKGQYIGIPILKPNPNAQVSGFELKNKGNLFSQLFLDKKLAKFLGYYVGDGYYSNGRVGIALNKTETEYQEEVSQLIEDVFGSEATIKGYGTNCIDIGFYNTEIGEALKKICGKDTYNKKIPYEILFNPNEEYLKEFLKGYYNADGHIYNETNAKTFIGMTTVNKILALQLQQAFTRFGVLVSIFTQPPADRIIEDKVCHCKEAYRIQSSQKEAFDVLGLTKKNVPKRRTRHFFEYEGVMWAKIDEITKNNVIHEKVFNCEVEKTHSYLAHNYIVHNCYQLILDRRLGDYVLPENWSIIAAGNRAIDKANIFPMAAPLKNRFSHATLLVPSEEEWREWAFENDIKSDVIAFMAFKPSMLFKFDSNSNDDAFPTPRTWALASYMTQDIKTEGVTGDAFNRAIDEEFLIVASCVGTGAALEYQGFVKLKKQVKVDDILKNPKKVKELKDVGMKYSLISGLAEKYKHDSKLTNQILCVVDEMDPEFGVFLLRLMKGMKNKDFVSDVTSADKWDDIYSEFNIYIF